jgi:hypothetical protein
MNLHYFEAIANMAVFDSDDSIKNLFGKDSLAIRSMIANAKKFPDYIEVMEDEKKDLLFVDCTAVCSL